MSDVQARGPAAGAADGPVPTPGGPLSYIHWGPVIAGAVVAAAVFFTLMTFASAVGLAVASPSPTWRDASIALAILSGVWILLVALGSFALGGYLAGRVRSTWATSEDEREFRDGAHGLLVRAVAVVIGALLTWTTDRRVGGRCRSDWLAALGSGGTGIPLLRARPPVSFGAAARQRRSGGARGREPDHPAGNRAAWNSVRGSRLSRSPGVCPHGIDGSRCRSTGHPGR